MIKMIILLLLLPECRYSTEHSRLNFPLQSASVCKTLEVSADYILFGVQGANQKSSVDLLLSNLNEEQQLYAEKMIAVYVDSCKNNT